MVILKIIKIYKFSMIIALAPPPPLQIAAAPYLALFCFKTLIKVTIILEPEFPSGCPKETAPPFTFTLSASKPKILLCQQKQPQK